LVFKVVVLVVSVLVVVILVVSMVSVVLSLLDVLYLMLNTSLGEVAALSLSGATDHGLPFVDFVFLHREKGGFLVVVLALVDVMEWIVLIPLWSRWLGTSFTLLVLTPVLSRLHTHVLVS
jgi:hypothetical protein